MENQQAFSQASESMEPSTASGGTAKVHPRRVLAYDCARVFAIISISLNHAVKRVYENYHGTQEEAALLPLWEELFKAGVTVFSRYGVCIFLMLTGALILSKKFETSDDLKRFFKHNWLRLLIAVEIWQCIYFFFNVFWNPSADFSQFSMREMAALFVGNLLFMEFDVNVNLSLGLMWYMYMIIPLYTVLPIIAVFIHKGMGKYLAFPLAIIVLIMTTWGLSRVTGAMDPETLVTVAGLPAPVDTSLLKQPIQYHVIYVVLGYAIAKGRVLGRVKSTALLGFACLAAYCATVLVQLWFNHGPSDYAIAYDTILMLVCASLTFELFCRIHNRETEHASDRFFAFVSRRTLGIFFVHIIIMELMVWYGNFDGWSRPLEVAFLEIISVVGSMVVIVILSAVKPIRDYVFLIK